MGVELIKDSQGYEHMAIDNEFFNNEETLEEDLEAYEDLKILGFRANKCITKKVLSKLNNKIYVIKELILSNNSEERKNLVDIINFIISNEHKNIVKYHKFFIKSKHLYIIEEFINNDDLKTLMNTYKDAEKDINSIEENILWDIFMQCATALKFLHENNIIHRNISLDNILVSNDKTIKFSNFEQAILINGDEVRLKELAGSPVYRSPEMEDEELSYGKKTDIFSLGFVFHKLCTFEFPKKNMENIENINNYSEEMINIIELMLKEETDRPDSNTLYEMILKEYSKRAAKISSIESIIRCMNSFSNFSNYMLQKKNDFQNENKTPFSFNYIKCIEEFGSNNDKNKYCLYLNHIRDLINNIDFEVNRNYEINPLIVLDYLVEKLNKETNENPNASSFKVQPTEFDTKKNAIKKYDDFFKKNYKSGFSQYFSLLLKTVRCDCTTKTYYFSAYPYLEFQLDRCYNIYNKDKYEHSSFCKIWLESQQNHAKLITEEIPCKNCIPGNKHHEFKMIEKLPKNVIIAINRGKNYSNTSEVDCTLNFELNNSSETIYKILEKEIQLSYRKVKYKLELVGVIKRVVDESGEYFISINKEFDGTWIISDKNSLNKIKNPENDEKGNIVMLFYSVEEENY